MGGSVFIIVVCKARRRVHARVQYRGPFCRKGS